MNDAEVHEFLQGKVVNDSRTETVPVKMVSSDLKSVAEYLNSVYVEVKEGDSLSLRKHLKLGKGLITAKTIFDIDKRKNKTKETWADWVKNNTTISEAYARQHKEVALLIREYPKLETLAVSFTELFKMKNKIKEMLVKNIEFSEWWKAE